MFGYIRADIRSTIFNPPYILYLLLCEHRKQSEDTCHKMLSRIVCLNREKTLYLTVAAASQTSTNQRTFKLHSPTFLSGFVKFTASHKTVYNDAANKQQDTERFLTDDLTRQLSGRRTFPNFISLTLTLTKRNNRTYLFSTS